MKKIYLLTACIFCFISVFAQVSEDEFQALKALYNATGGDNWTNRTGWENINTTATKNDVTTAWVGINIINDGHIEKIYFYENNLSGQLPAEIGNLVWLKDLDIEKNNLTGTLPGEFGNLTNLVGITLNSNNISGPLPASMINLINLKYLYLSSNPLNCNFPNEIIVKWPNIEILDLKRTGLMGSLNLDFNQIPKLDMFSISENQLSGEIPASISKLKSLSTLSGAYNLFSGNLPTLDSCQSIQSIDLGQNNFSGTIPQSWENLTSIKSIELQKNNLTGVIPDGIFKPGLNTLLVDRNYFTFEGIEPVITKLKNLTSKSYWTDKFFTLTQNTFSVNKEDAISLNATSLSVYNLGGNNNRYKWFRNEEEVYSGNSPIYQVTSADNADAGIYRFEVTNTVVTGIILKSENITITIAGANEAPTDILLSANNVNENFNGTVATLTATDANFGDVHTFILASGNGVNDKDNSKFSINGNQLVLNNWVNFETTPSLSVLITANDGNGGIFTKAFVIAVNDVNEAPEFNNATNSVAIDENLENGAVVLNLQVNDPEGSPVTFSITAGNENGAFGINGGNLVVANNAQLNYDVKNQYVLTVQASDGVLTAQQIITVSLNKINRLPQVENATFALNENAANGTQVGTITASDPESQPLSFVIAAGNTSNAFSLNENRILVANAAALDYETNPVFNLTVNVSDGASTVPATITININNLIDETGNDILSFSVPGMVGQPVINNQTGSILVSISQSDITALQATFTLSKGAVANTESGSVFNFFNPKTITVTAENGAVKTWTVSISYITAIDQTQKNEIAVYPNPATEYVQISGIAQNSSITLFDIGGKVIKTISNYQPEERIQLNGLNPGIYLICIEKNDKPVFSKIIIQ